MTTRSCEHCGKHFQAVVQTRRFCCRSCAARAQMARRKADGYGPIRKHTGETVPCEVCGTLFYRKAWQARAGHGRFCQQTCYVAWQARNKVHAPCEWCGAPMQMSPFRASIQRFCSWSCQTEGRSRTAIDRWHNGRRVRRNSDGYLMVYQPDHPSAYADGWMPEHRLVAERMVGRILASDEHVHHISGQKDDNAESNLAVLSPSEHRIITNAEYHAKRRSDLDELEEYRRRYGPLEPEA